MVHYEQGLDDAAFERAERYTDQGVSSMGDALASIDRTRAAVSSKRHIVAPFVPHVIETAAAAQGDMQHTLFDEVEQQKIDDSSLKIWILANTTRDDITAARLDQLLEGGPGAGVELARLVGKAATRSSLRKRSPAVSDSEARAHIKAREDRYSRGINELHPRG